MKMTKKILLGVAAALVAFSMTSCAGFGEGDTDGAKWDKGFKLDATDDKMEETYSRSFMPLSTSKECCKISSEVKFLKEESIETANEKNAVVGLAFDVHKTGEGDDAAFDFVLVGFKPADGGYYIERYKDVKVADLKESMKTNNTTIGGTYDALATETNGWAGTISPFNDEDGNKYWSVDVKQDTAGTYDIYINNFKRASYKGETKFEEGKKIFNWNTLENVEVGNFAYGQVYMYGNAPKGTLINARYVQDKKETLGLYAEVDE